MLADPYTCWGNESGLVFHDGIVRSMLHGRVGASHRPLGRGLMTVLKLANERGQISPFWQTKTPSAQDMEFLMQVCPFKVGQYLYVKERWSTHAELDKLPSSVVGTSINYLADRRRILTGRNRAASQLKPHQARLWLYLTDVALRPLHTVSDKDALLEGVEHQGDMHTGCLDYLARCGSDYSLSPRQSFKTLWQATGNMWRGDPYVWHLQFKTMKAAPYGVKNSGQW